MLTVWYPSEYFKLMNGQTLIYLIAGVDIFIGPLLTLAVFRTGKKGLKFDLACIAALQIVAMSYGLYVMLQARPIFTMFNKDAFFVASVVDIVPAELAKGKKEEWRTAPITGPKLVAAATPDPKNRYQTVFYETESQTWTIQQYPRYYDEYYKHKDEVIKAGKPLNNLAELSSENRKKIDVFLKHEKRPITDFLFLPIRSATGEMSAVIDAKTADFIRIIDATSKLKKQKTNK